MIGEDGSSFSSNTELLGINWILDHTVDSATVTMKGLDWEEVVKILTSFTSLDLLNNRFQGKISNSTENLKSPYMLNKNDFYGPILASLENLKELESLELSRNKFVRKNPLAIDKSYIYCGLEPLTQCPLRKHSKGQQFFTFTNSSFVGNDDLCGLLLSKRCENAKLTPP